MSANVSGEGRTAALRAPAEALHLILRRVSTAPAEPVPLREALGRMLAQDVVSNDDVPGFDNSAMDGFALRASDTAGATEAAPADLSLVGESRAGAPFSGPLEPGQAVRISTGAMLPPGSDAVLRVEDAHEAGGKVSATRPLDPGREVRRAGDDITAGDVVLRTGTRVGAAELGVAASTGAAELACARRPTVAVVVTGDELVEPGAPLRAGAIRNTNGYVVPAQVAAAGGEVVSVETVGDDYAETVATLRRALAADVVVSTGGVSVGAHDHVKAALAELGVEEVFWGVALRPGHPTWFGTAGPVLVFGLPGNPVSAMVTFHLFARPALDRMLGNRRARRRAAAVIDTDYRKRPGRAHVVRCTLEAGKDGWHVRPTKEQGSHVFTSMLGAEAFAFIEVERGDVAAGELVEIEIL
ncbi:MAG: molybdopterin molybdotransferase MoeA [Solirubrobacterales bacterium]